MKSKLRRRKKLPKCITCEKPIPRSEPDVILQHPRLRGQLYFHKRCALDAYKALIAGKPHSWRITHRHIDPEAN